MNSADEIRYLILATQREGNRLYSERLRPLGLTPSQAEVLSVLHQSQPLSLIELGEQLVCENGSPSRLVDGLVKAELVKRTPSSDDQRKVSLSLTPRGEQLYTQVIEAEQLFSELISSWGSQANLDAVKTALWQFVRELPSGRALIRKIELEGKE
ncbi:MAG TPA: MarR family transcriptional regulator [Ktedonobacteraceae bacterium]|nr:MarR family transcriptional regulator [Ktedonobacteraceae bacterium]